MRTVRIHRRSALVATLLGALLARGEPARAGSDDGDAGLRAVWTIARGAEDRPEGTVARLRALGAPAIPALFAAWAGREQELLQDPRLSPESLLQKRKAARQAMLKALAASPPAELHTFLRYCVEPPEATDDTRLHVLRLLGEIGGSGDLELVAMTCASFSAPALQSPLVHGALRLRLGQILGRDPAAFAVLSSVWKQWPEGARDALVEAAGDSSSPRAVPFLLDLATDASLRATALQAVLELKAVLDEDTRGAVVTELRRALESPDVAVRRVAVVGLEKLDDIDAIEPLLRGLEDPDRRTRALAEQALETLTGHAKAPGQPWSDWWQSEKEWWDREGSAALADLHSDRPDAVLASLRVLAQKRYFYERFQAPLREALQSRDAAVRRMAVAVLGRVGSTPACRLLRRSLEDPDPGVRSLALEELRRATGLDLPPDPQAWEQAGFHSG